MELFAKQCPHRREQFQQLKEYPGKESKEEMNRRGNGYLDDATERLRDEQEKDSDPKTAYEDRMTEEHQDSNE